VTIAEGTLLWEPSEERRAGAVVTRYLRWLQAGRGLAFADYAALWEWSVTDLEAFWASIVEFFGVAFHHPPDRILLGDAMPGARWLPGAELNYAEHALRRRDEHVAVVFRAEDGRRTTTTYRRLAEEVAAVADFLRSCGVRRGDRVAGYLPNIPQTVTAFLATAAVGAVWAGSAPEFGVPSVVDRFRQLDPKVLFAVDGYRYNGRTFDRSDAVAEIRSRLPSLEATVAVGNLDAAGKLPAGVVAWADIVPPEGGAAREPVFDAVPAGHPLWVLWSSGTTGLPKGIVQSHGGILLEQLKMLALHQDLTDGDRFFWFTTTGWVMWNRLVSALAVGATIVLFDGSPSYPDLGALWQVTSDEAVTFFGTGAPQLLAAMKAGLRPGRDFGLRALRSLGSTGAPLPPDAFAWVYDHVKDDLMLGSLAGGTDVCTALIGCCPILPVRAGESQCRSLGARVEAYDERGRSLVGDVGELVITAPMPSMPLHLWDDEDGRRLRESYFATYPGVWRHGDWIKITPQGGCVIYGRSDSTVNRGGIRMGTSELYRIVEAMPEIAEGLVVHLTEGAADGPLLLFVALRDGAALDDELRARIVRTIRQGLSPRHVPDEIHAVPEVPRTLNGKKLEVPIRRILLGTPPEKAVSADAMGNPAALQPFVQLAARRSG
jgi:acetoacetyl-CoA synthetase